MADSKLSALTALTAAGAAADDLALVSDMSGTPESKKMRYDALLDAILRVAAAGNVLTLDATGEKLIVRQRAGTPGTDEVQIYDDGSTSIILSKQDYLILGQNYGGGTLFGGNQNASRMYGGANGFTVDNTIGIGFTASTLLASQDAYLTRTAAGVLKANDWIQTGGRSRVNTASPVTNATDTMAAITGLSATLIAGRKYAGTLTLYVSTDVAAEGAKFDFDGGAATMTSFNAAVTGNVQAATPGTTVSSALATDLTFTALNGTGVNCIVISLDIVCNAGGTFIPRFAQVAHALGTLTVVAANLNLDDIP